LTTVLKEEESEVDHRRDGRINSTFPEEEEEEEDDNTGGTMLVLEAPPRKFFQRQEELMIAVFWVVAPCSLVEVYQRFRGPCCLQP
jgi:hypothetical protein